MPYDTAFQRKNGKWLTWLRIVTLVTPAVALSLLAFAYSLQSQIYTDGVGGISDFFPMVPLAYSFAWSLSFLIAAVVKSTASPMHPGFPVGFDLCAWASLLSLGILGSMLHIEPGLACHPHMYGSKSCKVEQKIVPAERTADALLYLDVIFHFILFVSACRACHELRKEKRLAVSNDIELHNKVGSQR